MSKPKRSWISADPENRQKDYFYPTPPEATRALLSVETFDGMIWEPACGDGAMSKVLRLTHNVFSSDLNDYGYGTPGVDFLLQNDRRAPLVVTNPPFKLAQQFAEHALDIGAEKVALLCRLSLLEGTKRKPLFEKHLSRVWVFSNRLTINRNGVGKSTGGMVAYAWFIFVQDNRLFDTKTGWLDSREFRND